MKGNRKKMLTIFAISVVISLIITPLRGVIINNYLPGIGICSLLGFILYFFYTTFCIKKFRGRAPAGYVLISILLGISMLQLPVRIVNFDSTLGTLPDFLLHLLGIVLGYISYERRPKIKYGIFFIGVSICMFMFLEGYYLWHNKLNYGTYTGKIEQTVAPDFQFADEEGKLFSLSDFSGKYTIVDFWFIGCGVCFKKFPKVQALYDKYKGHPGVSLFSINSRLKGESDSVAFETIRKEGYSFPVYRMDIGSPALDSLKIRGYPVVLIFDKEGKNVFRGSIENAGKYIEKIIRE